MSIKKLVTFAGVVVGTGLAFAQPMKPRAPEPPAAVDYAALAERLVSTTANVKEGDIVQIVFGPNDLALAEEIVVAVHKRGGFALPTYDSENLARKLIAGVPEKFDTRAPKLGLELAKLVNVRIVIPAVKDPSIAAALSPERRAKIDKAEAPVMQLSRKKNMRNVELDNSMAPTPLRAKFMGVSEAELGKLFWDGVNTDYKAVEAKCKAVSDAVAAGKELQITAPNGTDLKLKLKGRKTSVSDGVISDADIKAGGPGVQAWLPAGEGYFVPTGVDGKLVDDRLLFEGKEVTGVQLDIKANKVTAITAKANWEAVKGRYDAAGPGKLEVGAIDFGCNPAVRSGGKVESWVGAGMVSIVVGGNVWAGGTNKEPLTLDYKLPDATVILDGKPIIEKGALKL